MKKEFLISPYERIILDGEKIMQDFHEKSVRLLEVMATPNEISVHPEAYTLLLQTLSSRHSIARTEDSFREVRLSLPSGTVKITSDPRLSPNQALVFSENSSRNLCEIINIGASIPERVVLDEHVPDDIMKRVLGDWGKPEKSFVEMLKDIPSRTDESLLATEAGLVPHLTSTDE